MKNIKELLPHRDPFLFVDRITGFKIGTDPIVTSKDLVGAKVNFSLGVLIYPHKYTIFSIYLLLQSGHFCNSRKYDI